MQEVKVRGLELRIKLASTNQDLVNSESPNLFFRSPASAIYVAIKSQLMTSKCHLVDLQLSGTTPGIYFGHYLNSNFSLKHVS